MLKQYTLSGLLFSASTLACPQVERAVEKYRAKRAGETTSTCPQYAYKQVGADWASLCPEYSLCGNGTNQSPIDLPNRQFASTHKPSVSLPGTSNGYLINTGFGPQWEPLNEFEPLPSWSFDGNTYQFLQWHTHKPHSEHAVNGYHTDGEIHFVFVQDGAPAAVFAVLLHAGNKTSRFFGDIFDQLDAKSAELPALNSTESVEATSPFSKLLNEEYMTNYWTYAGSLTTPPCTEGIRFFVSSMAETMTLEQSQRLEAVSSYNGRELQPIINQQVNV